MTRDEIEKSVREALGERTEYLTMCAECGSANVETLEYVDANTGAFKGGFTDNGFSTLDMCHWCEDCGENVTLISEEVTPEEKDARLKDREPGRWYGSPGVVPRKTVDVYADALSTAEHQRDAARREVARLEAVVFELNQISTGTQPCHSCGGWARLDEDALCPPCAARLTQ